MMNIRINNKDINEKSPPYIIAEISGNHNGSLNKALKMIEVAKESGADAVKIQTYTADTMTINSKKEGFIICGGLWDGYSLYDLYEKAHTPWEWHEKLFKKARDVGITLFSTPFDESSVDFLEQFDPPAYKIASFEIIDISLIERVCKTRKPIIISTGMANLDEISLAIETTKRNNINDVILLHCVSGYPTPITESNLSTIKNLNEKFNTIVGLSDHTLGITSAITSIGLGSKVIEKHFTLDRSDSGLDSEFSIEPDELRKLCNECKLSWLAVGEERNNILPSELPNLSFRRSIYVTQDIHKGEKLTIKNVRKIRPGFGLEPKYYPEILGRVCKKNVSMGTPLSWDLIEK